MSGAGGEDGGEGEALADGEELGVVVEDVASTNSSRGEPGAREESQDAPTTRLEEKMGKRVLVRGVPCLLLRFVCERLCSMPPATHRLQVVLTLPVDEICK